MYSVPNYNAMLADRIRVEAYARALQQAVRPDSVVVDIGVGTGIMTLLACRFGARRVIAIEPEDVIQVAREMIRVNGYADRVEFFQQPSVSVTLPEAADVIVSDLRGALPLYQSHLQAVVDARKRLLKPGGVLIPRLDTMWAAIAELPDVYSNQVAVESDGHEFNFEPARRRARNSMLKAKVSPEQLLVDRQCWATLDYTSLEPAPLSAQLRWTAKRDGVAHGVVLWFDTVLLPGVEFSNSPASPELVYGKVFLPLEQPVSLEAGDSVAVTLHVTLVKGDYLWRWETRITGGASPAVVKSEFAQSTFYAAPLSPAQLRKQSADFVPAPNPDAEVDFLVLTQFRAGIPLGHIARHLAETFPERFASEVDALTHVAELSLKYSR
jgi:protein arginine N-methyltransferase 1